MMLAVAVKDMPKAKAFYSDELGLEVASDYRQDDGHWWVALNLPEGGVTITLSTFHENVKPGAMKLWFGTSRHLQQPTKNWATRELKSAKWQMTCMAPGSGVKWFNFHLDPDGESKSYLEQV